jgi:RimJ/RimL family protein N-acetyltransferase
LSSRQSRREQAGLSDPADRAAGSARPHIEDADALANLANNLRVASMVSRMPHPYTRRDAEDFIRRAKTGGIGKCVLWR